MNKANSHRVFQQRRMLKRNISRLKQRISLATIPEAVKIQEEVKKLETELKELDRSRNHV